MRITLLTEIPAPFRIPLFNALAAEPQVDFRVLFLAEQDPKRPYPLLTDEFRFDWRVLSGRGFVRRGRWIVASRGVARELERQRPHVVVVGGWNQPAFWQALAWARVRRRPLVTWVESTSRDARAAGRATEWAKRLLLAGSSGFLVPGRASREYLEELGVPEARIAWAPNAVDEEVFGRRVALAQREREQLRRRLGLDEPTFLYVGRLDEEKGVDILLEAVRDVPASLVVAGDGAQGEQLRQAASARVRFLGRLHRDELVAWYAAADAFVLPSRSDQWGMVLNEAAAAGLPLVATEAPGAAWDLVEDGVNGYRVPAGDAGELAAALRRVALDGAFREAAGRRSRELAAAFTAEAWASAVAGLGRRIVR
jgi:glycosyltransferase involved in cell wall biosynthesis